jgi:hypothetical protein
MDASNETVIPDYFLLDLETGKIEIIFEEDREDQSGTKTIADQNDSVAHVQENNSSEFSFTEVFEY